MTMILVEKPISREELKSAAHPYFEETVKAVVDLEKRIMAIGGELHADEEAFLLERSSSRDNLWGINLLTEVDPTEMVEFDSMINIRPRQQNLSRGVESEALREKILAIVKELVI
jgi:Protein of unknown function (DUF5674)